VTIPDIIAAALTPYLLIGLVLAAFATFGEEGQYFIRRDGWAKSLAIACLIVVLWLPVAVAIARGKP
jgi:hypothetical protein